MTDKIFGSDYSDETNPTPTSTISVNNGINLVDVQLQNLYKAFSDSAEWVPVNETWTYAAADAPTYAFTVSGDKRTKYQAGQRINLTQSGTVKYFIIVYVYYSAPNTIVTIYGGLVSTLANDTISSPFYSKVKAPFGFPLEPDAWTVSVTDASARLFTATKNTWAVPTGSTASISIPIGSWRVGYRVVSRATVSGGTPSYVNTMTTLSTTTNSETDASMTNMDEYAPGAQPVNTNNQHSLSNKIITVVSKTTYYLLHKMNTDATASGATSGFNSAAYLTAECAYL